MRTTTEAGRHQAVALMNPTVSTTQTRLRNSCDACNTAKVKCSKEHPCCRRCQRKQLFCVYSVSLRCSKRPLDGRSSSSAKRYSTSTASTEPTTSISNSASMTKLPLSTGLEGALDATTDSATSIPTTLFDFDSLSALSEVNFDLHNLDDYFSPDTYLPPTNFNAYTDTTASTTSPQGQATPSLSRRATPLCGCQQHILSKLSELSFSSSGSSASVPFDHALSENRAIVALCTSTLDCVTCARSDDVMLILTLSALLAHVLQVFETLFRSRREALQPREGGPIGSPSDSVSGAAPAGRSKDTNFNMFSGLELLTPPASRQGSRPGTIAGSGLSTPRNGSVAPSFGSPIERGPPVRLSLGTYELDERDEFILQTSLLKIELGKVTSLIEAFEARLCQTKLHHDLVAYLKQNLGANYEALKRLANVHNRSLGRANCVDIP